jgi:hypothetical protein
MVEVEVKRHHSRETKIKIGLALEGRIKPLEEYVRRCTILNKVRPLFVRGGTTEKIKERAIRSRAGKTKHFADRIPISEEEGKTIEFAKIAQEKGFFTDDLTYWNKLNSLYESLGRELPSSFYERLRLETFLKAIMQELKGNILLSKQFIGIGDGIDRRWFCDRLSPAVREQRFIRDKLAPGR